MAVENVCFNAGQAYTVAEWSGLDQAVCETAGGVWQILPNSLELLFQTYFHFDPAIFSSLIGFGIVAFVIGFGIGAVINLMSRNTHY